MYILMHENSFSYGANVVQNKNIKIYCLLVA